MTWRGMARKKVTMDTWLYSPEISCNCWILLSIISLSFMWCIPSEWLSTTCHSIKFLVMLVLLLSFPSRFCHQFILARQLISNCFRQPLLLSICKVSCFPSTLSLYVWRSTDEKEAPVRVCKTFTSGFSALVSNSLACSETGLSVIIYIRVSVNC